MCYGPSWTKNRAHFFDLSLFFSYFSFFFFLPSLSFFATLSGNRMAITDTRDEGGRGDEEERVVDAN